PLPMFCTVLAVQLVVQVSRSRGRRIPASAASLQHLADFGPPPPHRARAQAWGRFPSQRPGLVPEPLTNPSALTSMTGMHSPPKPLALDDRSDCRPGRRTIVPHRMMAPE